MRQVGSSADEFWNPLPGQGGNTLAIVFGEEAQRLHAEGHVHVDDCLLPQTRVERALGQGDRGRRRLHHPVDPIAVALVEPGSRNGFRHEPYGLGLPARQQVTREKKALPDASVTT